MVTAFGDILFLLYLILSGLVDLFSVCPCGIWVASFGYAFWSDDKATFYFIIDFQS